MTIQLELDPTLEANLIAKAQAHGVDPNSYAQCIIQDALSDRPKRFHEMSATELDAFLDAMKADIPSTSELREATFDREMIYSDHD